MCIDYQNLNDCTEDALWPIPNMNEMLRRIGAHKVFATLRRKSSLHLILLKDIIKHRLHLQHAHALHSYFSAAFINSLVCLLGLNELLHISNRPWQLLC